MKEEMTLKAYTVMTNAEYEVGEAVDRLKLAQEEYKVELMNECIQNILSVQNTEGNLTERDLQIFLRELIRKTSNIKIR